MTMDVAPTKENFPTTFSLLPLFIPCLPSRRRTARRTHSHQTYTNKIWNAKQFVISLNKININPVHVEYSTTFIYLKHHSVMGKMGMLEYTREDTNFCSDYPLKRAHTKLSTTSAMVSELWIILLVQNAVVVPWGILGSWDIPTWM